MVMHFISFDKHYLVTHIPDETRLYKSYLNTYVYNIYSKTGLSNLLWRLGHIIWVDFVVGHILCNKNIFKFND